LRDNPVKTRLGQGGMAFGATVFEFFSPGMPQILRAAGCEFVMLDMEHSGVEFETIKAQIAACRGIGLVPQVRVPATQYHFIARALDVGAMSIMVPMVETEEQAKFIVSCTRYPPQGRRGAAFGVAHDDYMPGPVVEKIAAANARTMVIALVETPTGIQNIDAIAAVPGVDVVWLGHFDFTNFAGIPAQFDHPTYLAAVDRLVAACGKHGKAAGIMAHDVEWAKRYMDKGFRCFAWNVDIATLQTALATGLRELRAMPQPKVAKPAKAPAKPTAKRAAARGKAPARKSRRR
jgi:2-keto-3-deoxy-L-rhamnonate aldolase RhmA